MLCDIAVFACVKRTDAPIYGAASSGQHDGHCTGPLEKHINQLTQLFDYLRTYTSSISQMQRRGTTSAAVDPRQHPTQHPQQKQHQPPTATTASKDAPDPADGPAPAGQCRRHLHHPRRQRPACSANEPEQQLSARHETLLEQMRGQVDGLRVAPHEAIRGTRHPAGQQGGGGGGGSEGCFQMRQGLVKIMCEPVRNSRAMMPTASYSDRGSPLTLRPTPFTLTAQSRWCTGTRWPAPTP